MTLWWLAIFLIVIFIAILLLKKTKSPLEGLVDNNNINLWNQLKLTYQINVVQEDRVDYMVHTKGKKAIIYIQSKNINPASFTHELLHIKLDNEEIRPGKTLQILISRSSNLSFLTKDGIDHIGNCLDHIKMLPIFLEMGYERKLFIQDYDSNKASPEYLSFLMNNLRVNNKYSSKVLDLYIVQYFSIVACPNKAYNYEAALKEYKAIEPGLYTIIEKFIIQWGSFDPQSYKTEIVDYRWYFSETVKELDQWALSKIIN